MTWAGGSGGLNLMDGSVSDVSKAREKRVTLVSLYEKSLGFRTNGSIAALKGGVDRERGDE